MGRCNNEQEANAKQRICLKCQKEFKSIDGLRLCERCNRDNLSVYIPYEANCKKLGITLPDPQE